MNNQDLTELLASSTSSNNVLVNDLSEIDQLYESFDITLIKIEKLCEKSDPETEPFKSKYEARNIIESLIRTYEGTRVVAVMDQKHDIIINLDWRIARLRVKLATIDWDCEEPHNTEVELGLASKYYFNELYETIINQSKLVNDDDSVSVTAEEIDSFLPPLPTTYGHVSIAFDKIDIDVLKCLNLSGILWAGRGNVKRSFMFLHSLHRVYHLFSTQRQENNQTAMDTEIESVYTHCCYYLAQCYGHLGDVSKSSFYCHETLQRQLKSIPDSRSAIEWIRNCLGMSDYYISRSLYTQVFVQHCHVKLYFLTTYCQRMKIKAKLTNRSTQ